MTAVVFIESVPARERAIRAVLADSSTPSSLRSARAVAPRVADALGVPVRPLGASLEQALAAFSNRAAYQVVAWTTERDEPSPNDYRAAGTILMTLVSYLAHHENELR